MDLVSVLVEHIIAQDYDSIPESALDMAKLTVLDTLGVAMAAKGAAGWAEVVSLVKEWGGKEESTIWFDGGQVPAPQAALANGLLARALDFDCAMDKGMHLDAALVPVALAIGELKGNVSGKEFLAAITLGEDVGGRLNAASARYYGFDPTPICGLFATTTVAAKLLGLNKQQLRNALGLALNECSGTFQANIDGTLCVRLSQGSTAAKGITGALLAQRGVTGPENVLEGSCGYINVFPRGDFARQTLTDGLGEQYYGQYTIFKRWPSCGGTLAATDIALDLADKHGIGAGDISKIIVYINRGLAGVVGNQFHIGDNPAVNAQFSLQYTVANAIVRGDPSLKHFTEAYIKDHRVLELVKKVTVGTKSGLGLGAEVEIELNDGRLLSGRADFMKGHPGNPLTADDIRRKFYRLAHESENREEGVPEKVEALISKLEDCANVREMVVHLV